MKNLKMFFVFMLLLLFILSPGIISNRSFARPYDDTERNTNKTTQTKTGVSSSVGKSIANNATKIVKKATNSSSKSKSKSSSSSSNKNKSKSSSSSTRKNKNKSSSSSTRKNKNKSSSSSTRKNKNKSSSSSASKSKNKSSGSSSKNKNSSSNVSTEGNKNIFSSVGKTIANSVDKVTLKANRTTAKEYVDNSNLSKKDKDSYKEYLDKAKTTKEINNIINKRVKKSVKENKKVLDSKRNAICKKAKQIANNDKYSYGEKPYTSHYGCPFCGTNDKKESKSNNAGDSAPEGKSYKDTFNCVTFINSAITHGTNDKDFLEICKNGGSVISGNNKPEETEKMSNRKIKTLKKKPDYSKLKPGDILVRYPNKNDKGHTAMYVGNEKFVEATSRKKDKNGNILSKDKKSFVWGNASISEKKLTKTNYDKNYNYVLRYVGKPKNHT